MNAGLPSLHAPHFPLLLSQSSPTGMEKIRIGWMHRQLLGAVVHDGVRAGTHFWILPGPFHCCTCWASQRQPKGQNSFGIAEPGAGKPTVDWRDPATPGQRTPISHRRCLIKTCGLNEAQLACLGKTEINTITEQGL